MPGKPRGSRRGASDGCAQGIGCTLIMLVIILVFGVMYLFQVFTGQIKWGDAMHTRNSIPPAVGQPRAFSQSASGGAGLASDAGEQADPGWVLASGQQKHTSQRHGGSGVDSRSVS
jgi:hypothetical protein